MDNKVQSKWAAKFRIVVGTTAVSRRIYLYGVFRNIMRNLRKRMA